MEEQDQNVEQPPKKRGRGRPTPYKPEFNEQAYKLCLLGYTLDDLGKHFGVDGSTICVWQNKYPEFRESIKAGGAVADAEVVQALYKRAIGYSHKAVKIFKSDISPKELIEAAIESSTGGGEIDIAKTLESQERTFEHEYTEHYPPDFQSMRLWLMNRQRARWRDVADQPEPEKPNHLRELVDIMKIAKTDTSSNE